MAQSQAKTTESTTKAAPAPVAGNTQTDAPKASATKTDRRLIAGPAYERLVAAGASIVPLASKGKLHSNVLSQLGASMSVKDLPAAVTPRIKGWDQFDRGYLVGPAASYSACAVNNGSKKAKAQAGFVYANRDGKVVTLFTSDGQIWPRPAKEGREQTVYDAALKSATEALSA